MMDLSKFSLEGKVALVTGGSRGIGCVTAIAFARAGATVIVSSRKLADLEEVVDSIRSYGGKGLAVPAHIGKMEDIRRLTETIKQEFGSVDILVNNAGGNPAVVPFIDAEERLWDTIMNLNLKGLFFLSQAMAKLMLGKSGGVIINVASISALKPEMEMAIYAISKAGVVGATKAMALELAKYNIRVNALLPGVVRTHMTESNIATPGNEERFIKNVPMSRLAQPEDMVGAMLYLASPASDYMTGQTLVVDGGSVI
jgi:NAD(P)-dependent dehydrogenase (short-subunit alcohol dehydrogenase family)